MDTEDDAVNLVYSGNWKIPTVADFNELLTNTDFFLVSTDGTEISGSVTTNGGTTGDTTFNFDNPPSTITGIKFYKKNDRSTSIFLPASGVAVDGAISGNGTYVDLWTSSLYPLYNASDAYAFQASCLVESTLSHIDRCIGINLRPVYHP